MSAQEEPPAREGWVDPGLAAELGGLRLVWSAFDAVPGRSPPEVRERLRRLSDEFRGPQAIALRQQAIPQAYRVFFRHIGLEPDEQRVPVEALALERMKRGRFPSRSLLDDALTIAVIETSVGVWALDADRLAGEPGLRPAAEGEPLGRGERAVPLPAGRLVVADDEGPVAVLFGDPAPGHGVTSTTRRIALYSVAVPGVPPVHVEEALWIVWDIVTG
jgi:DNA/RNA-binding domain of Phe-tRNA-synthetase-like protein